MRYVLEGSVRKAGNRIRVTAQLVEAETGNHVWADRYDRDLADIFAVQDEITEAVTIAIAPAIADAELRRAMRKPPESLDAWAAYQRGLWHLSKANPDDDTIAQNFFRQAIDLDPTFAGGYSGLALAQLQAAAVYQKLGLARSAKLGRGIGTPGGRARRRRCGSPIMSRLGIASARRARRRAGRDRASAGDEPQPGSRAWAKRRDANLLGTAEGGARGSRNVYQARSPRSVYRRYVCCTLPAVFISPENTRR